MIQVDDGTQTDGAVEELEKGRAKGSEDTVMRIGQTIPTVIGTPEGEGMLATD